MTAAMVGSYLTLPLVFVFLLLICLVSPSPGKSEAHSLLRFKDSLKNATALSNWNSSKPPCGGEDGVNRGNWDGVMCEGGEVRGLNLNGKGLAGVIDVDSLTELAGLRVFGAMHNNFGGALPDFKKLSALKHLYLSHNKFSGEIPSSDFVGMKSLKKLHLANNRFVGPIPSSLAKLGKLIELMLENNNFNGKIPEFEQERFTMVNLSNNSLQGEIPPALSSLDASSFQGNDGLCGPPLKPCGNPRLSLVTEVIAGIALAVALVAIMAVIVIMATRKPVPAPEKELPSAQAAAGHRKVPSDVLDKLENGSTESSSPEHSTTSSLPDARKSEPSVKLSFLIESRERFGLSDLLQASAEVLGSGVFGSTYKAALSSSGPVMVVKRFKCKVGKEDFHEQMRRLGRLSHENLLPVVAFYYRKEEKLLVSDFADNASLASHLHGNRESRDSGRILDWPTRLKIVKGVAKALSYLYTELPSLTAPHGHLKSTNILLNSSYDPLLNDYGLLPVVNPEHAQQHMIAYRSPEFKQDGKLTKKTDVWALGILILEILTGKFPQNYLGDDDLAGWVGSAVGDDDGGAAEEVLDEGMITDGYRGEMVKLLRIGLRCCEADVEKRWDIREAVKSIEDVRERDGEQ